MVMEKMTEDMLKQWEWEERFNTIVKIGLFALLTYATLQMIDFLISGGSLF